MKYAFLFFILLAVLQISAEEALSDIEISIIEKVVTIGDPIQISSNGDLIDEVNKAVDNGILESRVVRHRAMLDSNGFPVGNWGSNEWISIREEIKTRYGDITGLYLLGAFNPNRHGEGETMVLYLNLPPMYIDKIIGILDDDILP